MTVRSAQSLDLIITDDGLDPATVDEFREAGVNLVVAERGPDAHRGPASGLSHGLRLPQPLIALPVSPRTRWRSAKA